MGLICMFIVPADFHTEYRNTMHSVASMALTFSMLKKPTAVKIHPCRPVTYQQNTEFRPTARKLVHDVNKVIITDIGSYYLAKGFYLYYSSFQPLCESFQEENSLFDIPLAIYKNKGNIN